MLLYIITAVIIIGLVLALMLNSKPKVCPKCGKRNSKKNAFCASCGTELPVAPKKALKSEKPQSETTIKASTMPEQPAIPLPEGVKDWSELFSINQNENGGLSIVYYKGSLTSVVIPSKIDGKPVTTIGRSAFEDRTSLKSVIIPNSVTTIRWDAFSGCTSLKSITIPSSVTYIGWWAFFGCTSLQTITIPNSVTEIGWSAFEDCTGLTNVTIPDNVTYIWPDAFKGCYKLADKNGLVIVKNIIFDCINKDIQTVVIPSNVTDIDNFAFKACTSLESITIPNSVTTIGNWAFSGCTSLRSITIPFSLRENTDNWALPETTKIIIRN